MSPLRSACLEGKDVPADTDGKQEKENTEPKRIDYKEDAIEQSGPYHGDRNDLGTEGNGFVFAETADVGTQCGMRHEPTVEAV